MKRLRTVVALALLTLPLCAWAMPPLLAAAGAWIGAQLAGMTVAAFLGQTLFLGVTVGGALFASTLVYGVLEQRRQKRKAIGAYNRSLTDRYAPVMSASDAPWQVVYGECTVGACQVPAQLTSGSRDEFKHVLYVWAAHECNAVLDATIAGVSVGALDVNGWVTTGKWFKADGKVSGGFYTLDGAGSVTLGFTPSQVLAITFVTSGPFGGGDGNDGTATEVLEPASFTVVGATITVNAGLVATWAGRYVQLSYYRAGAAARLRVRHHLGTAGQAADSAIITECPADWSSTDQLKGLCYSWVTYCLDEPEFQGGPADFKVRLQGKKLYDHRTGLTVYSDTAALCVADFLRGEYGKNASSNQMGWASFDAGATACEEALVSQGGAKRYTVNGAFRTDMDPDATLDALCQAMAGFVTWDGVWNLQAGVYTAPVASITDADNAGSVEVVADKPGAEVFNGLRGRFYDPARYEQLTDYTPYQNAAFVTADGAPMWDDLDLPFSNAHWRAHNLARIQVERSRGMQLVYPAKLSQLKRKPGQRVSFSCSALGITAAVFRVVKRDYRIGRPVLLTLQQDDASMYDEATAPAVLPSPATAQPDPFFVDPVSGFTLTSGDAVRMTAADGTIISRVRVDVTASTDGLVTTHGALQVQYRLDTSAEWSSAPEEPGTSTYMHINGLKDGRFYLVQARWRNGLGAFGDWRGGGVMVRGKTAAPGNVGTVTVTAIPTGLLLVWPPNGETDYLNTEIHEEATWNNATAPLFKSPATRAELRWPSPGAHTYLLKHRNFSGQLSATAASVTVTVGAASLIDTSQVNANATYEVAVGTAAGPVSALSAATEVQRITLGPYAFAVDVVVHFTGQVTAQWTAAGPPLITIDTYMEDSQAGVGATQRSLTTNDFGPLSTQVSMVRKFTLPAATTGWMRAMGNVTASGGGAVGDYENMNMTATVHKV